MAIYHLSAQVISRGYGHSAVHAAAYRARCELADERTGLMHDYSRKAGELLFEGIYAPKDAPEWARDRAQLWNHVEAFEKHRRAELAREFVIALPHELTLEQARYAVQDWARDNFTRKGLIADVTIHAPGMEGDDRNIHAHIMAVTRKLDGTEFVRTKERFETYSEKDAAKRAELEGLRESWARIGNRHLERHGFEPSLDHRTLEAQGIEREPTIHMGKAAAAIERDGNASELGDVIREIKVENERRVIDLAAERAMREAQAAARGQVDDIRADRSRDFSGAASSAPEPAREAAETREAPAASSAPERETTRATEREAAPAREAPAVIYLGPPAELLDHAADIIGGLADGAEKALGATLDFAADFIAPPPPLTKDQAERMERAAEEQREQARPAAEKDARLQELLEQIRRDNQQRRYDRYALVRDCARRRDRGRGRDRPRQTLCRLVAPALSPTRRGAARRGRAAEGFSARGVDWQDGSRAAARQRRRIHPGMIATRSAYHNSLCNEIGQGDEPWTQAPWRQSDDDRRAAGPLPGGAHGRHAESEIPEARRPALAPAALARGRGRAGRAARRIPGLARYAAREP